MADDWKPGDLALCVTQDDWVLAKDGTESDGPVAGRCYTVLIVGYSGPFGVFLGFSEWPRRGFHHSGFVKVTPPDEMVEQERRVEVDA